MALQQQNLDPEYERWPAGALTQETVWTLRRPVDSVVFILLSRFPSVTPPQVSF